VTDSEYLEVLKEFGVIGFLPYLAYFLFPLYLLWTGLRAGKRCGVELEERLPATFLVLRLGFVMAVTALVMNIGMSTFYNLILQSVLWIWLGLGARAAKSIRGFTFGHTHGGQQNIARGMPHRPASCDLFENLPATPQSSPRHIPGTVILHCS